MGESVDYSDYTVSRGYIDETGTIIIKSNGITYHGCPHCGACFVWDCFCGFAEENQEDIHLGSFGNPW